MKKHTTRFLAAFFICIAPLGWAKTTYANMLITPTQLTFNDRDRFSSVTLVNPSSETKTYDISWSFFEMQEDTGSYITAESPPTDFDLSKHIVYSPRRVTLKPGASQKIRLALRRPASIPDGDYRAHMEFTPAPDIIDSPAPIPNQKGTGATVSINISYSIPVTLRVGKVDVHAAIGDLEIKRNEENGLLRAIFPVNRTGGPYSIMGHVFVYHIDNNGNEEVIGEISNAHVFSEVNRRIFDVLLTKEVTGGALRVVLRHYDKSKNLIYAEKIFPLE